VRPPCTLPWVTGIMVLLTFSYQPIQSAEAQATFALKAGWVECSVRQDGKPVGGASLQILDERGVRFAEGETGPNGGTTFPFPAGSSCVVAIKTGKRSADPIRLLRTDCGVEPRRVLLSYGLQPCCRSKITRPEPIIIGFPLDLPSDANEIRILWITIAAALIAAGIVLGQIWWLGRRCRNSTNWTKGE
jgi:hypothetical protein